MRRCTDYGLLLSLLIDNELDGEDKKDVENHLNQCTHCREVFNRQRWFLSCVRKSLPAETADDSLRSRVEATISTETKSIQGPSLDKPAAAAWSNRPNPSTVLAIAACAAVLVMTVFLLGPPQRNASPTSATTDFANKAAETHRRHLLGQLPLELTSGNSASVSEWFNGKVPFRVMLPNYQHVFGQKVLFELEGARLVGFNNDYAAYIAYQMEADPVSLVVTSSSVATPSGGKTVTAKSIDFHYNNIDGLQVISWSHRGLTYALVSDFDAANSRQSCIVCHIGADDPAFKASVVL